MLAKLLITSGLASAGLLLIIMLTITPKSGGAGAILAVFLLSYISILSAMTFVIWILSRGLYRILGGVLKSGYKQQPIGLRKAYYYSSVTSLGPVIVISLQSVGEVGLYELGLIFVFMLLGCVYVAKRSG